jgi:hypothetical protein
METYIGPSGEADDTDTDGLDEAAADLTDYALRGTVRCWALPSFSGTRQAQEIPASMRRR